MALWRKIGVAERPTAERAIAWLKTLPLNESLPPDDLRRVKALLARHPARIWNECACWINLIGEWAGVESVSFSLTVRSLVPWSHLHVAFKRRTADFQKMPAEILDYPPFAEVPTLASRLEERFNQPFGGFERPEKKAWIVQLAADMARIRLEDEDEQYRVRHLAEQLGGTLWQNTPNLEIVPYIDGTPAGTAKEVEVVWAERTLYVKALPPARLARLVPERLARAFIRPDIAGALSYCFERSSAEIGAYMQENFDLEEVQPIQEAPAPASVGIDNEINDSQQERDDDFAQPDADQTRESLVFDEDFPSESPPEEHEPPSDDVPPHVHEQANPPPKPQPRPKPAKASVIERYALNHGFRKVGDDRFECADGSWIARSPGEVFSWTRGNGSGEVACYYWTKDHCLEHEPLQIDAEVWSMVDKFPKNHALLLSGPSGNVVEIHGEKLRAMCEQGNLILYPATYRLVYQNGKQ